MSFPPAEVLQEDADLVTTSKLPTVVGAEDPDHHRLRQSKNITSTCLASDFRKTEGGGGEVPLQPATGSLKIPVPPSKNCLETPLLPETFPQLTLE